MVGFAGVVRLPGNIKPPQLASSSARSGESSKGRIIEVAYFIQRGSLMRPYFSKMTRRCLAVV